MDLLTKGVFRTLNVQKETLTYATDLGNANKYVPCDFIQSNFYKNQIAFIKSKMQEKMHA